MYYGVDKIKQINILLQTTNSFIQLSRDRPSSCGASSLISLSRSDSRSSLSSTLPWLSTLSRLFSPKRPVTHGLYFQTTGFPLNLPLLQHLWVNDNTCLALQSSISSRPTSTACSCRPSALSRPSKSCWCERSAQQRGVHNDITSLR